LAKRDYPFVPLETTVRKYSIPDITRLLFRDGFIDRYTGDKLVFPAALRLLSALLPNQFPYHPHWKIDATHPMYWELSPTVDHVVPVAGGGLDNETNWMSVSMLTNGRKSKWTLEDLGWSIVQAGDIKAWDGLAWWFITYVTQHQAILEEHKYLKPWYVAAQAHYPKDRAAPCQESAVTEG
jgi:hypothetical protein